MQHTAVRLIAEDVYLAHKANSPLRHEYVAGKVYVMTGAGLCQNVIDLKLATTPRGSPCRVL